MCYPICATLLPNLLLVPFCLDLAVPLIALWTCAGGGGVLMMDKLGRFEATVAELVGTVQRLEMEKTNQGEEVEG